MKQLKTYYRCLFQILEYIGQKLIAKIYWSKTHGQKYWQQTLQQGTNSLRRPKFIFTYSDEVGHNKPYYLIIIN